MRQVFLQKKGNPRLLLFFAGWGADEHLFDRPVAAGWDYMLCFDYRTMDFDRSALEEYEEIRLLAWSMGVWVAGQVLSGHGFPWGMRLAVNGTSTPVSDVFGIPSAVFQATLGGLDEASLVRFRRRMCGTVEQVKRFLSYRPCRPLHELREELAALAQAVAESPGSGFVWDKALIGTDDRIFPLSSQRAAWKDAATQELPAAHYDDELFNRLLQGEDHLWTRH